MSSICNAFTVDVEDYFHVSAFSNRVRTSEWDQFQSRVENNTRRILRLLAGHGVRATFYFLGWVAERYPSLVRDVVLDGHELGCHSYWHRLIYDQSEKEFDDDLRQALDVMSDRCGAVISTYRAPSFSVTRHSLWALPLLAEAGITIDSSIFPVRHDRYGIPDAPRFPHQAIATDCRLIEFPPSVYRVANLNLPVAGGGYFRMLPLSATIHAVKRLNCREQQPFMFYIHPWEVDPEQPRLPGRPLARLRHYQGLKSVHDKLDELLRQVPFGTVTDALASSVVDLHEMPLERVNR